MLWEHKPQSSVSTAYLSSPKLSCYSKWRPSDKSFLRAICMAKKVKSAYEPSGPSGWSLSQSLYEVTRSISTPLGWDASPLQGYPLH